MVFHQLSFSMSVTSYSKLLIYSLSFKYILLMYIVKLSTYLKDSVYKPHNAVKAESCKYQSPPTMINFINISAMTNNLRSENLMTQKLSEAETKCQNKTKKILYQYLYLLFVYHKKKIHISIPRQYFRNEEPSSYSQVSLTWLKKYIKKRGPNI